MVFLLMHNSRHAKVPVQHKEQLANFIAIQSDISVVHILAFTTHKMMTEVLPVNTTKEHTASNFWVNEWRIDNKEESVSVTWNSLANHSNRRRECPEPRIRPIEPFWVMFTYMFLNQQTFSVYLRICVCIEDKLRYLHIANISIQLVLPQFTKCYNK